MPLTEFPAQTAALPLLLCLSHLRWDSVVQRPHHLMRHASERYRVVFWEEPVDADPGAVAPALTTRLSAEGILVATPQQLPGLEIQTAETHQVALLDTLLAELGGDVEVVWYYTPMMLPIAAHLQSDVTVYDCMDELSAFQGASPQLLLLERRLLRRTDLVFTGGRSLYVAKCPLHASVHLFPSSVDAGHFGKARGSLTAPADQRDLPGPRIGFHGVIDERLDLDLVAQLADQRPDWQFMMVGPVVKIDPATLPQRPNIHWLGAKPYADLPDYLAGWDAGFMPFALNEATRFISPTKTPEFLAAGVPVVSTPVPDVVHDWGEDSLVQIAGDAQATVLALERVMAHPLDAWQARVDRRLQRMSWRSTWARMQRLIEDAGQENGTLTGVGQQHA
jgi:glycosyltransferase involved in cell wall biosynthesis